MITGHVHVWTEYWRHKNKDRVRTSDKCECGSIRYGVYAFRLDDLGEVAWGPVGQ